MSWLMTFCPNSFKREPLVEIEFDDFEAATDWVRENAADLLAPGVWSKTGPDFRQFGTDNRWASFRRAA